MVVDDDQDIRETIQEVLGALGYRVFVAANGKEALEVLTALEKPCLILLDLMMPVMNGWQFREQLENRPALADVPVVAVSAHATREQATVESGFCALLRKPISLSALMEVTEYYCGLC